MALTKKALEVKDKVEAAIKRNVPFTGAGIAGNELVDLLKDIVEVLNDVQDSVVALEEA